MSVNFQTEVDARELIMISVEVVGIKTLVQHTGITTLHSALGKSKRIQEKNGTLNS